MNDIPKASGPRAILPTPKFLLVQEAVELAYALRHDEGDACAVVQLVAARSGDGTTAVAWDLALAGAGAAGLRVLLVAVEPDAHWSSHLQGSLPSGTEAVAGKPRQVGDTRLHIAQMDPSSLAQGWTAQFAEWRARFDLVLLDSPALARSSAAVMLAGGVDTSILVVAAEATPLAELRALRDRLWDVGGHTRGVVLNRRREHLPGFIARRL